MRICILFNSIPRWCLGALNLWLEGGHWKVVVRQYWSCREGKAGVRKDKHHLGTVKTQLPCNELWSRSCLPFLLRFSAGHTALNPCYFITEIEGSSGPGKECKYLSQIINGMNSFVRTLARCCFLNCVPGCALTREGTRADMRAAAVLRQSARPLLSVISFTPLRTVWGQAGFVRFSNLPMINIHISPASKSSYAIFLHCSFSWRWDFFFF